MGTSAGLFFFHSPPAPTATNIVHMDSQPDAGTDYGALNNFSEVCDVSYNFSNTQLKANCFLKCTIQP